MAQLAETAAIPASRVSPRRTVAALRDAGDAAVFSRNAAGLFVALAIMNASNYAFHVTMSRALGPGEYGALSSLLAVLLVMSVPLNALQTTVAKRAAELREEGRGLEIPALSFAAVRVLGPLAVLVCAGLILFAPAVGAFLHVGSVSVVLLALYGVVSLILAAPLGALQGLLRFRAMAGVMLAGVIVRFVGGVVFVQAGWGIDGALLATVLAPAVSLALAQFVLRRDRIGTRVRWSVALLRGQFRATLLGLGAFWTLAGLDVVLARHYLGPEQAGFYSSAAILARALLFVPGAISTVAFPWFVKVRGDGDASEAWLRRTTIAVAALAGASLPVLVVLRRTAVTLAFGEGFAPAARLIPVLAVSMGMLALANLFVYFCIAQGVRGHVIIGAGMALEVGLVVVFHGDPEQVGAALFVVSSAVTAGLWLASRASCRSGSTRDEVASVVSSSETFDDGSPLLSLVLPCHNAGHALGDVLEEATGVLAARTSFEIVVVSDGSTDDTVAVARRFATRGVRVLAYERNRGKGHALRLGLFAARGRYVAYMDADGDISSDALAAFLSIVDLYDPDVVVGSKRHALSEVDYPWIRRVMSWAFHALTRILFRVPVHDTQTGIKLVRRDVLSAVLPQVREVGYAFDLELLVVAERLGFTRMFDAPVRIGYRSASQIRLRTPIQMLVSTAAIFARRYLLDSYRRPAPHLDLPAPVEEPRTTTQGRASPARTASSALRILVVNWRDIANPQAGGAEVFTHEVARRWVQWGHQVTLLTSRFPGGRPSEAIDGVEIRRVGSLRRGSFHLLVQRELARVQGYDVLVDEINTLPFLTPMWSDRLPPVVGLIHQLAEDVWDLEMPGAVAAVGRRIEPRILRMYHDVPVVTISSSTRADLERLGFNDVRLVLQGRDEPPDVVVDKENTPTFLFVGRLSPNKRPDHAVAAFREIRRFLPDARLWMIGRGVMEETLRNDPTEGVELLGHVPRTELYERMARAQCLLVPSVREGWGLVITEANAVGTPAVGYDAPGIRDAIRDGRTGLLSPSGDPIALGRLAAAFVADDERYRRTRTEAVRWGRCFNWATTAELLLDVLVERAGAGTVRRPEETRGSLAHAG